MSYFLRHMQDSELVMRHHGLGAAGAKAIAISLIVSNFVPTILSVQLGKVL